MCLCLSLKRFGSKYRKITKHRRNVKCLCRSQRYCVFRSFVLFVCGNHETAGRAFRNFFRILIGKLRNEAKTTKRAHYRRVTGHKKARPLRVTMPPHNSCPTTTPQPCHVACRDVLGSVFKVQVAGYCARRISFVRWPLDRMWRFNSFLV